MHKKKTTKKQKKTPGFEERKISDFKDLELIGHGPISTVYKARFKEGIKSLRLRDSMVIIKGYHFGVTEVRLGKIIQILTHLVTALTNYPSFIKIHGFIKNINEIHNTQLLQNNESNKNNKISKNQNILNDNTKKKDKEKEKENTNVNANESQQNNSSRQPMFGLVLEFADRYSFTSQRRENPDLHYVLLDKVGILIEAADGLMKLHQLNMLHRNIKASNLLLAQDDSIKITDYCMDITQLFNLSLENVPERLPFVFMIFCFFVCFFCAFFLLFFAFFFILLD